MAREPDPETHPPAPRFAVIVRREAVDRYAQLREMFDREGSAILWDRRLGERRRLPPPPWPPAEERRRGERRRPPPETWRALDFVIARRQGSSASP